MSLQTKLKEIEERAAKATPANQLTLARYDHGGGRLCGPTNWMEPRPSTPRDLVADFYDEANREFYTAARTDVPRLVRLALAQARVIASERFPERDQPGMAAEKELGKLLAEEWT